MIDRRFIEKKKEFYELLLKDILFYSFNRHRIEDVKIYG